MKPGVSIIICCYNSAKRLPETLRHLALQEVPSDIRWEVIVVNNASTDDTVHVAEQEWSQYNLSIPFRIVDQPKPGLSNARDKGFEVAEYEYCLFCDDDNWLQKDYVRIAFETMESDPMIGAVGGQGEPVFEGEIPDWFYKNQLNYAVGSQESLLKKKNFVFGAGSVIRKTAYLLSVEKGYKSILSDRNGTSLDGGGDKELCYVIQILQYKILYNERLQFKHYLPKNRLNIKYLASIENKNFDSIVLLSPLKYQLSHPYLIQRKHLWIREFLYVLNLFIKSGEHKHIKYLKSLIYNYSKFNYSLKQVKSLIENV